MLEINQIYNMDCLEGLKLLPDDSIDIVVTSPPYNMRTRIRNGKYTEREKSEHFSKKYSYFHDALPIEDYYQFHKKVIKECLRVGKMLFWNIQIVTGSKEAIFKLIGDFNKQIKDIVVWDKGHGQPAMHDSVLNRATELIVIFEKDALAGRAFANSYFERGTLTDIWRLKRPKPITGHGACYPTKLVKIILEGFTKEGDIVLDPFLGSGTTAVACKQLKRKYIGFEICKEYVEIAQKRLSQKVLFPLAEQQEGGAIPPKDKSLGILANFL